MKCTGWWNTEPHNPCFQLTRITPAQDMMPLRHTKDMHANQLFKWVSRNNIYLMDMTEVCEHAVY